MSNFKLWKNEYIGAEVRSAVIKTFYEAVKRIVPNALGV